MTKHIPNFITLLNVLAGCVATVFAVLNQLELAALFVFIGIFFDFLDGFVARALNAYSDIGVQLDSLADMITSGLVPGIVMFQLLNMAHFGGWNNTFLVEGTNFMEWKGNHIALISFLGFLITMGAAYRLANFNVDENQVSSFLGLPTPANALLILSLPLILVNQNNDLIHGIILNQWFLIGLTLVSVFLMNSKIKLFALKFKGYGFKGNGVKYIFLVLSLILIVTLRYLAIPAIITLYILSSLLIESQNQDKVV